MGRTRLARSFRSGCIVTQKDELRRMQDLGPVGMTNPCSRAALQPRLPLTVLSTSIPGLSFRENSVVFRDDSAAL